MKQAENSYTTFKKDFEKSYKEHKNIFKIIVGVFVVGFIAWVYFLFWGSSGVRDNKNDWEVQKLMFSTQDALDTYYKQNQIYPSDIRNIEIRHYNNTFKFISSNEIEYLGYKIYYTEIDKNDYKLETYLKGPQFKGKYILYKR